MHATDLKSEKGGILLSIIFLIIFLGTFGAIVSRMVASETKMRAIYTSRQQAFYTAEAGIEYAIKKLQDDGNWRDGASNISVGGGNFTVTIDDSSTVSALQDSVRITSVGEAGVGVKTLKAYILDDDQIELLMVVGSVPPNYRDVARKALIESWGYHVGLIDDNSGVSQCNAAVDTSDVVYISEEVWGPTIGNKFANYAIGIVSEENYIDAYMGFAASSSDHYTGRGIYIHDNTHYITSPFNLGYLTILNWSDYLPYLTGTLAPGRQTLAKRYSYWENNEVFIAVEKGATLWNGSPAPGRRVRLGWGQLSFDSSLLNDAGKTIMRRSIEWAADASPSADFNIVKWIEE